MSDKAKCPSCGDYNYSTDPVCLSCGADLRPSATEQEPEPEAEPTGAAGPSPAEWDIVARDPARAERLARARELALQVESFIEQGYHRLPKEPDARYGPADDVSDLCREIGECHLRNEDYEEAVNWLGRALVISPQNAFARAYLVGALCRLQRYDEAKAWYEETPGDPIDKNVVRAWLELPDEPSSARHPWTRGTRGPRRAPTENLLPSKHRTLPTISEPRSA